MTIRINTNNTHNAPNSKNEIIEEIKGTEVQKETEEVYFTDNIETQETETTENEDNFIIPSFSLELFNLINDYREQNGLIKYTYMEELQSAADTRAYEASESWNHTRPDGSYFNTVSSYCKGENLAKTYTTAHEVLEAWKESPTHDANLLDKDFTGCAISKYESEENVVYVSIEFYY